MIEERYELALDRIRLMQTEDTVGEPYKDYFKKMAEFVLMLDELRTELLDGRYQKLELDELRKWNRRLYQDVLPGQYEKSYANPDYACKMLGKESGQILGMLYAELRGAVVYVFEGKTEYLAILYELLIEVYNQFEEEPDPKAVRDTFYWYASDYCDVFLAERIREQVLPEESFATDLIMNSDLTDLRYLYQFGEYISENEWKTAEHLNSLPGRDDPEDGRCLYRRIPHRIREYGKRPFEEISGKHPLHSWIRARGKKSNREFRKNGLKTGHLPCGSQCADKETAY